MRLKKNTFRLIGNLSGFFFPQVCLVCDEVCSGNEVLICRKCSTTFPRNIANIYASGDKRIKRKKYFSYVAFSFYFNEPVRRMIHQFKFNEYYSLKTLIGIEMGETALHSAEIAAADCLVPVPLHLARLRERGYNQSELLAGSVSEVTGIPILRPIVRVRNSQPQSTVMTADKISNVKDAFALNEKVDIKKKKIVLIDDIVTTGSTVNECARLLIRSGADSVTVLAAAYAG